MRGWADPASLRAAWWAERALATLRRDLQLQLPVDVDIRPPPRGLPDRAVRGVRRVLVRRGALCLESSLLHQQWLARRGRLVDVVIGVTGPRDFTAHAWLDGFEPESEATYVELIRRPARARPEPQVSRRRAYGAGSRS